MEQSMNLMDHVGFNVVITAVKDSSTLVGVLNTFIGAVVSDDKVLKDVGEFSVNENVVLNEIFVGRKEKFGKTHITTYLPEEHIFKVYVFETTVILTGWNTTGDMKENKILFVATDEAVKCAFKHDASKIGFVKGATMSQLKKLRSLSTKPAIFRSGFGNKKVVSYPSKVISLCICQFGEIEFELSPIVPTQDKRTEMIVSSFSIHESFVAGLYHHDNGASYPFDFVIDSPSYFQHESIKKMDLSAIEDPEDVLRCMSLQVLPYFEYVEKEAKYRMPVGTNAKLLRLAKLFGYSSDELAQKLEDLYASVDQLEVDMNVIYLEEINSTGHDQVEVFLYNFRWYRVKCIDVVSGTAVLEKESDPNQTRVVVKPSSSGSYIGIIALPNES